MEQEPPSWLNESFLATVLQGGEANEPQITICKFSAKPAVEVGNNFSSFLFRVRVQYKVGESNEQSISLIVKAPFTRGFVVEIVDKFDLYAKEPKIYYNVIPRFNEKLNIKLGPKSFYCSVKNGLVLKDMLEEGYVMCDKYKQLDFLHCKHALMTLAKFHAASVDCYHDNPDLIESVGKEILYNEFGMPEEIKTMVQMSVNAVKNIVKEIDSCKQFLDIIFARVDNLFKSVVNISKRKTRGLNVLNHGDFWTTNMLFKHNDSGDVIGVTLIDFQATRYTSPALDLVYFICSSANEDVCKNKLQELYSIYLETLNNTLEQLGCEERMHLEELREDLRAAADIGLVTACQLLPMIMNEAKFNPEDLSQEDFKNMQEKFKDIYSGKRFIAILPNVMKVIYDWASLKQ